MALIAGTKSTDRKHIESVDVTNHAAHVADVWPLRPVSPLDATSGAAAHEHYLNAGTNSILFVYVIVGPTDLVTAGDVAKEGGPECSVLIPGSSIIVRSETALQKLYLVGVASATNVGGNVIGYSETDDPTIRGELIELEFNVTDSVKEAKLSASAAATGVLVNVGGRSDA